MAILNKKIGQKSVKNKILWIQAWKIYIVNQDIYEIGYIKLEEFIKLLSIIYNLERNQEQK